MAEFIQAKLGKNGYAHQLDVNLTRKYRFEQDRPAGVWSQRDKEARKKKRREERKREKEDKRMKKRVTPWTSPVRSRAQCLQKRPRTVTHLPLVIPPLASISFFPFFLNKPFLSNVAVSAGQINVTSRRLGLVSDLPNGPPKRLVTARRRHQLNETRIINTTTK